ncbi:putative cadmium-exporting ATPase [Rosa chinensis]|uniref:Putative cadmium-exporting ATPase n=1 Tax=Rosa chinensis TaxID=74649 RepID=A0A2P6RY30_ROSCH|nr:putative cadmium-exporting ATPase [Rosa chinensis]
MSYNSAVRSPETMFGVQVFGAEQDQVEGENKSAMKLQKSYFDVLGLCCSSEVALVENILKPLSGVKEVSVILPSKTVIVVHDSHLISQIQIGEYLHSV